MHYRSFGTLDWRPSALGFGCMRFPRLPDGSGKIDETAATAMVRHAIDHGVNYLDTAYIYSGSEECLGRALAGGYRERVRLATKLPREFESLADADRILGEQLQRLDTDHIDFYLLHAMDEQWWAHARDLDVLAWAERKLAQGVIGHFGFSFHAGTEALKDIIDAYDGWTFCQIQYNYLDVNNQAGVEGLRYAHAKGLAVVIMEPLRGGLLATPPPGEVADLLAVGPPSSPNRSPAEWGLAWLWDQPEVSLVLSGMSSLEQVAENLASADRSGVGRLSAGELAFIDRVAAAYRDRLAVPCTYCGYCRVCPEGLDLPQVFEIYNGAMMLLPDRTRLERIRQLYPKWGPDVHVERCTQCGECEARCSQGLPIREFIDRFLADLGVERPAKAGR